MVDFLYMNWVVSKRTTGLGVLQNTYQVSDNVCNTWKMLHCQDVSIYFCINISIEYMMIEILSIVLRTCLLISKMRIALLPSASAKTVSFSKNKIELKSQDVCVLVPAKTTKNPNDLGKVISLASPLISSTVKQIISQVLFSTDILCPQFPMIPQV